MPKAYFIREADFTHAERGFHCTAAGADVLLYPRFLL